MSSSCGTVPKFEIVNDVFPALRLVGAMTFHSYRLMVGLTAIATGVAAAEEVATGMAVDAASDAAGGALITARRVDGTAVALEQAATAPTMTKVTIAARIDCMMSLLGEHPDPHRSSCPTERSIHPKRAKTRSCGSTARAGGAARPERPV